MEKVVLSDISKYLIVMAAGSIALFAVFVRLIGKIKGSFSRYRNASMFYALAGVLLIALAAVMAFPSFFPAPSVALIVFEGWFLLLGSAHIYLMRTQLSWSREERLFLPELIFTLLIAFIGGMAFLLVFHLFNKNGLEYIMLAGLLCFIVPLLFIHSFTAAAAIPPKAIRQWFYPVGEEIDEPEDAILRDPVVISFEFQKNINDQNLTNFRAKAPVKMEFGLLFYYFINDYNERHQNSKVQFTGANGKAQGWVFYKRPAWYQLSTTYIDAGKSVRENKIKENDVIICTRTDI